MRVAYLTTDDVNPALARRWARPLPVRVVAPRPCAPAPSAVALVIDFDRLPDELRRKWVNAVLLRTEGRPVFVHGHTLPEAVADALHARGARVAVGRLRRPHLLRWLRRVVRLAGVPAEKLAA